MHSISVGPKRDSRKYSLRLSAESAIGQAAVGSLLAAIFGFGVTLKIVERCANFVILCFVSVVLEKVCPVTRMLKTKGFTARAFPRGSPFYNESLRAVYCVAESPVRGAQKVIFKQIKSLCRVRMTQAVSYPRECLACNDFQYSSPFI